MAQDLDPRTNLIWATRGRLWGFRFLLTGGVSDPLPIYERAFTGLEDQSQVWRRIPQGIALRFPDPMGRRDSAGRVIPQEFVVLGDLADRIASADAGMREIWPLVKSAYERVWQDTEPPGADDIVPIGEGPQPQQ